MKLWICFFVMIAVLPAAEKAAQKKAPVKPAATRHASTPRTVVIPAGAKETQPGTYSYTDAQGKKWIYRKTPFGIAKLEDKPAAEDAATEKYTKKLIELTTATEDGDYIRFERPGPFGRYVWRKKKTELDDMEKAVWNRERARAAAEHQKANQE